MRMYPRSEFPHEVFPTIIRANGAINRSAIAMRFSAVGCPHGKVDVTVAAIKAGADVNAAFQLGMLASHVKDADIENVERVTNAMRQNTLERAAAESPRSIYAYLKDKLGAGYRYITAAQVRTAGMDDYAGWSAWSAAKDPS